MTSHPHPHPISVPILIHRSHQSYLPSVTLNIDAMMNRLKERTANGVIEIEIHEEVSALTLAVVSSVAFGGGLIDPENTDEDAEKTRNIAKSISTMLEKSVCDIVTHTHTHTHSHAYI